MLLDRCSIDYFSCASGPKHTQLLKFLTLIYKHVLKSIAVHGVDAVTKFVTVTVTRLHRPILPVTLLMIKQSCIVVIFLNIKSLRLNWTPLSPATIFKLYIPH